MLLYIENNEQYSYDIISEYILDLFNDIMFHLVSCEDDMDNHEIELFKFKEEVSFSIECSCTHCFKKFDTRDIKNLEDDDKKSILNFVLDLEEDDMRSLIYEERERFLIKQDQMRAVKSPTIFSLEF